MKENLRDPNGERIFKPAFVPEDETHTVLVVQRHGATDNRFPAAGFMNPTEEEKATLGKLTPEGIMASRETAQERIADFLQWGGDKVDFVVVASPTKWLGHPEFGQRAIETGQIISDEVRRQLQDAGYPEDHLLNSTSSFHGEDVRESDKLVESQMFDNNLDFAQSLRSKYGGQGREFWDAYNADADREARKAEGAEGSPEAADRMSQLISNMARWSHIRHLEHPDRKTVIFVVSHHEIIEPYTQHALGTEPGEYEPKHNDAIFVEVDADGNGHTTVAGRDLEVPLAKHGKPRSVDEKE